MAVVGDLRRIGESCVAIAERAADENGFVSVRSLLMQFNASLRVRPLLVEGMLARTEEEDKQSESPSWLVLVDSERYPVSDEEVANESALRPLPSRFRFTVAHELCHTLAFVHEQGEVELKIDAEGEHSRARLVAEIEKETDRLTTLLLCPERALAARLSALRNAIGVSDLSRLSKHFGLSREAFVNRLLTSQTFLQAQCWQRPQLKDFGVLLVECKESGDRVFRGWPIFKNFSDGIVPEIFHRLKTERSIPMSEAFTGASALDAPTVAASCFEIGAGTSASPAAHKWRAELEVERLTNKLGRRSFALIRNHSIHERVKEFERLRLERIEKRE